MTLHLTIVWLHVFSSAVLFASGILTAMVMVVACGLGDERVIASAARRVVLSDWCLTCPSGIIQPVSGLWLVFDAGYRLGAPWLLVAYGLYAVAALCWLPVAGLQVRMAQLAEDARREGGALPAAFWRAFCWWFVLGWPAFGAFIGVFWLMVVKPALW